MSAPKKSIQLDEYELAALMNVVKNRVATLRYELGDCNNPDVRHEYTVEIENLVRAIGEMAVAE